MLEERTPIKKKQDEPSLDDYVKLFWERKWPIVRTTFTVMVITAIFSLMIPKTYRSSALLMPPTQSSASGLLSSLSNFPLGGLLSPTTDETMSFVAILKSRTVMEDVVNRFSLVERYDTENIEDALRILENSVEFIIEDEGTIRVSATASTGWFHPDEEEDTVRILSANMANHFVERLDVVGKRLKTQQATFHRKHIERRYHQNIADLMAAEDSLKVFQQTYKMIALPQQMEAAIEVAAIVKGQILANEVKMGVMASTLAKDHPEYVKVRKETNELKGQLKDMDYNYEKSQSLEDKLFPTFSEVPDLGVKLMRLMRDVEVQNTLFMFITQQYEEAKIQEAKDTPTIQILDIAKVPIRKYRPRRMLMVASMFLITLLIYIGNIVSRANHLESDSFSR